MDDSDGHSEASHCRAGTDGRMSRRDWERLPADPDMHDDLGYDLSDLEAHETDDDHVLIIPTDEDMLRDDAFIVIAKADVLTLGE